MPKPQDPKVESIKDFKLPFKNLGADHHGGATRHRRFLPGKPPAHMRGAGGATWQAKFRDAV